MRTNQTSSYDPEEAQKRDRQLLADVLLDDRKYIETFLVVKTKTSQVVPFKFSSIQKRVSQEETLRNFKLKPRQVGMSTYEVAKRLKRVCTRLNWTAVSMAHNDETTKLLFWTAKLFYNNLPDSIRPVTELNNQRELYFPELNSRYIIFTAGANGVGRGATVNDYHGSEVAFWPRPRDIVAGMLETIPKNGYVDLETTANGAGGYAYTTYKEAAANLNEYKAFFFPWWWQYEYRLTDAEARAYNVNPDAPLDAEEAKLVELHKLDRRQINWRRWKKANKKDLFPQEYPEDDDTCFLVSGRTYFDKGTVRRARTIGERSPEGFGYNGDLKIFRQPEPGHLYIIGADVAEGLAKGDFSDASVLDLTTGDEVATLHCKLNPHDYAVRLCELSRMYRGALVAVERNNHGHAVLTTLIYELGWADYLYYHEDYDQEVGAGGMVVQSSQIIKKPGWVTSSKTKPIILSGLQEAIKQAPDTFHDSIFFEQCNTFVYHDNGSIGAQEDCHDDMVMARAIAQQVLATYQRMQHPGQPASAGSPPAILQNYRSGY